MTLLKVDLSMNGPGLLHLKCMRLRRIVRKTRRKCECVLEL